MSRPTKHQFEHLKVAIQNLMTSFAALNVSPSHKKLAADFGITALLTPISELSESLKKMSTREFKIKETAQSTIKLIASVESLGVMVAALINQNQDWNNELAQGFQNFKQATQDPILDSKFGLATGTAIWTLQLQKISIASQTYKMDEDKRKKQLNYIQKDIEELEKAPPANVHQIKVKLTRGRTEQECVFSKYYNEVIRVVFYILNDLPTASAAASATSNSSPTPIAPPAMTSPQSFFSSRPVNPQLTSEDKAKIITKLDQYLDQRASEWAYHYNFLNIVMVVYFLSDTFLGTDYLDSKSRFTKINAATKYKQLLTGESNIILTQGERNALRDSRLGNIVKKCGLQIEEASSVTLASINS